MKYALLTLAFASVNAFAAGCLDISGTYISAEELPVKFVMQDCKLLTRYHGDIEADGSVKWNQAGMALVMNGKPNCGARNFCTTVTPEADRIDFKLNFQGGVKTDTHGQCSQNGYSLSLDKDGHLLADFQVVNCQDKFAGTARKTFKKL